MAHATAETDPQRWIRYHLWFAVWLSIGVVVVRFASIDPAWVGSFPLSGRIIAGMLGFVAVEAMTFVFVIRKGGPDARWAAGLLGAYFLILLFIQAMQASLGTVPEPLEAGLIAYFAAAHLGYAGFGSSAPVA